MTSSPDREPSGRPPAGERPSEEEPVSSKHPWRLDSNLVAELDALPTDLVVDVIKALRAAAVELAMDAHPLTDEGPDPMFVLSRAGGEELFGQWDVLLNEAESRLSLSAGPGRDLIDRTWDPSLRMALGHWAQLNQVLFSENRRWVKAANAASELSCSDYLSALAEAGEEGVSAVTAGLLPCIDHLAAERPDVARIVMRLWRVTSAHSPMYVGDSTNESLPEWTNEPEQASTQTAGSGTPTAGMTPTRASNTAQAKGTVLEEGLFEALATVFDLDEAATGQSRAELRRQLAGTQFGTDLVIRTRAARSSSTCLLECKNYQVPIKLSHISDKLLAAEGFFDSEPVDYWVLISPHSDPANDLDIQIEKWNAQRRFPFQIQIWSPQNGVRDLFALSPAGFETVYGSQTPIPNVVPSDVVADFTARLLPWLRVPASVDTYLRSPTSMLQPNEREWLPMLDTCIERRGLDADGRLLDAPLQEVIVSALQAAGPAPTALLTADFGEGKSFFTVAFCNALRERFLTNPSPENPIPFRFHLKDFRKIESASEFLQGQLDRIGVTRGEWTSVTQQWNVLVVLDGMDEMSVPQDVATTRKNFAKVNDLLGELDGLPVLVTTRPNFFGSDRDRERFYDRLRQPVTYQLTQPERRETVAHLREYANAHDLGPKLDRIKELYDPIGLAGKVLFLEMIKTTLPDLPEDRFDERILYETYIDKSFLRKVELLRDPDDALPDAELFDQLKELLEKVAVAIHSRGEGVVDLREFLSQAGGATNLLWKAAERPDEVTEEDAAIRVGGRSLLRRLRPQSGKHAATGEGEWLVDFFHRSMKEYFVARAIVRALRADDAFAATRALLREITLQPEIVTFFRLMIGELSDPAPILSSIARSAGVGTDSGTVGGSAITLFNASEGDFSAQAWSDLNLDGALLIRADLVSTDLRRSTMRGASFASADLTGADLRECDLTDANLGTGDVIVDLHGAATGGYLGLTSGSALTRLQVDQNHSVFAHDVMDSLALQWPRRVLSLGGDVVLAAGDAQISVVQLRGNDGEEVARFRIANSLRALDLVDESLLGLLVTDDYGGLRALLVDLTDGGVRWMRDIPPESLNCRWTRDGVMAATRPGLAWHPADGESILVHGRSEITTFRIDGHSTNHDGAPPAVFYGNNHGRVGSTRFAEQDHDVDPPAGSSSPVTALAVDGSTVLATSTDGSITVWEAGESSMRRGGVAERRLRCEGALVAGLTGQREQRLFVTNGALL